MIEMGLLRPTPMEAPIIPCKGLPTETPIAKHQDRVYKSALHPERAKNDYYYILSC